MATNAKSFLNIGNYFHKTRRGFQTPEALVSGEATTSHPSARHFSLALAARTLPRPKTESLRSRQTIPPAKFFRITLRARRVGSRCPIRARSIVVPAYDSFSDTAGQLVSREGTLGRSNSVSFQGVKFITHYRAARTGCGIVIVPFGNPANAGHGIAENRFSMAVGKKYVRSIIVAVGRQL